MTDVLPAWTNQTSSNGNNIQFEGKWYKDVICLQLLKKKLEQQSIQIV